MKSPNKNHSSGGILRAGSGISGLDEILHGGLPSGRTTLLIGGPGSGKTILALQTLVNGARLWNEPGIFVAFEENPQQIMANAASFGWDLPALQRKNLFFLNAVPNPDTVKSGSFDLHGLLNILQAKARQMGAKRIIFDSLDIVLSLLGDEAAERREVYRLHAWLLEQELTAIITGKAEKADTQTFTEQRFGFLQFMVDCSVALNHHLVEGISHRNLRVTKYRGSAFSENESTFAIGEKGVEVAGDRHRALAAKVTQQRVSSGVKRLDTMLGGGYHRGASVLITGSPGTAKSTLSGAFAEAACKRGERCLLVSFDSEAAEVTRNLASVNIQLERFEKSGVLRIFPALAGNSNSEIKAMKIKRMAEEHQATCVVIDPISALSKQGNELTAQSVVQRLTDWAKSRGITLLCTSLLAGAIPELERTTLQISTVADTWIHLNYLVRAGERNRALTIIKSRGTSHSNQVRELILSSSGVDLADVYTAGGEVLMGTLRWEKEQAIKTEEKEKAAGGKQRLLDVALAEAELEARLKALQRELANKRAEHETLKLSEAQLQKRSARRNSRMLELRQAD